MIRSRVYTGQFLSLLSKPVYILAKRIGSPTEINMEGTSSIGHIFEIVFTYRRPYDTIYGSSGYHIRHFRIRCSPVGSIEGILLSESSDRHRFTSVSHLLKHINEQMRPSLLGWERVPGDGLSARQYNRLVARLAL